MAVASVHPYELTYFNALAGGPLGGRHILSDSNLDWGQGLKGLARLQYAGTRVSRPDILLLRRYRAPALRTSRARRTSSTPLTSSRICQASRSGHTRYLAVSASLQWGPWGPPGFFRIWTRSHRSG